MTVAQGLHRDWQRFTPLKRLSRFAFYLCAVAAVVASLRTIDVIPEFLYDAPDQMVFDFDPPDGQHFGEVRQAISTLRDFGRTSPDQPQISSSVGQFVPLE